MSVSEVLDRKIQFDLPQHPLEPTEDLLRLGLAVDRALVGGCMLPGEGDAAAS